MNKQDIKQWMKENNYTCYGDKVVLAIEQCFNDLQPQLLPEPVAYMWQHEETGVTGFVEVQQVEWGFQENNPRLQIICPLYRLPPSEGE